MFLSPDLIRILADARLAKLRRLGQRARARTR